MSRVHDVSRRRRWAPRAAIALCGLLSLFGCAAMAAQQGYYDSPQAAYGAPQATAFLGIVYSH